MAVTTVNATLQGSSTRLAAGQLVNWSTDVRNQSEGSFATTYSTSTSDDAIVVAAQLTGRGASASLTRCFLFFDLSSISGTITAITLKVYGTSGGGNLNDTIPVESTAWGGDGTSTSMTTFMYNDLDFSTPYASANTGWTGGGYNDYTLNSAAISDANTNGYINIALIDEDADYSNNSPTFNPATLRQYSIDFNSLSNLNKVEVTHVTNYGNTVMGVASANIGEVTGVATANIGKVIGVQ